MRSFMGKIKPFSVELLRGRVIFCLKTTRASNCQIETGPIWAAFRIIPAPQTLLFCHFAMNSFNQAVLQAERQLIAANLFYGHGMLNAYDEAVYAALFCNQGDYAAIDWDAQYPAAAQQTLDAMIAQRCDTRKPMAYLTHEAFLHGFKFYVDERVIVPRSFIAELILDEFSPWVNAEQVHDVLELCTGSGCLAMMAAHVFEHAAVDAIDIDADALDVARHNDALYGQAYGTAGRINWIESDLYTHVPPKQYDVIFSNPPYVNSASMDKLPDEYHAEPAIALAGGADGMDLVRTIVAGSAARLKPNGILVVEIGNEYEFACAAFKQHSLVWLDTSGAENAVFLLTAKNLQALA
jgi:ribosomal protein L3 glutamine methyltransferase